MSYTATPPVILSAQLSENPTYINEKLVLTVMVTEPEIIYSGEIYSGEVTTYGD